MKCAYKLSDLEKLSSINKTILDPNEIEVEANLVDWEMEFYRIVDGKVVRKPKEEIDSILKDREKESGLVNLKTQMRSQLASVIGDYGDNIADAVRAIALAEKIRSGKETDPAIIKGFSQYCNDMIDLYGGSQAVLDVLNFDLKALKQYLAPYYPAKEDIETGAVARNKQTI
jgi:hypothetical protein